MHVAQLFRFVPGWIRVEAEGGYPERLLNDAAKYGIELWGVHRRQESVRFCCFAGEYRRLRRPAHHACVRMRVRQKRGLPFWIHRYRHRKGLLVGCLLYGIVLAVLVPRIWVVQVVGNAETPIESILEQAQAVGVSLGASMNDLDIKRLEIDGLSHLPTLSWITVNPSGCVARIEVLERKQPPQVLDLTEPSALIAVRDGRILSMTVQGGEPKVMPGEAVSAGTVLISGRKETEMGEKLSRAYGKVIAETERQITVTVPLVYEQRVPVENVVMQPTLQFLHWKIPLYFPAVPTGEYRQYDRSHFLQTHSLTLPLGVTTTYYVPITVAKAARTSGQAAVIAATRLAEQEQVLFAEANYRETDRKEEIIHGEYVLTVTYICQENIAVEVPLSAIVEQSEENITE